MSYCGGVLNLSPPLPGGHLLVPSWCDEETSDTDFEKYAYQCMWDCSHLREKWSSLS